MKTIIYAIIICIIAFQSSIVNAQSAPVFTSREQAAVPTREAMVVENAIASALTSFYDMELHVHDVNFNMYVKQLAKDANDKFDNIDLNMICAYRGNVGYDPPTVSEMGRLFLKSLWANTYYPSFANLMAVYLRGRNAVVGN